MEYHIQIISRLLFCAYDTYSWKQPSTKEGKIKPAPEKYAILIQKINEITSHFKKEINLSLTHQKHDRHLAATRILIKLISLEHECFLSLAKFYNAFFEDYDHTIENYAWNEIAFLALFPETICLLAKNRINLAASLSAQKRHPEAVHHLLVTHQILSSVFTYSPYDFVHHIKQIYTSIDLDENNYKRSSLSPSSYGVLGMSGYSTNDNRRWYGRAKRFFQFLSKGDRRITPSSVLLESSMNEENRSRTLKSMLLENSQVRSARHNLSKNFASLNFIQSNMDTGHSEAMRGEEENENRGLSVSTPSSPSSRSCVSDEETLLHSQEYSALKNLKVRGSSVFLQSSWNERESLGNILTDFNGDISSMSPEASLIGTKKKNLLTASFMSRMTAEKRLLPPPLYLRNAATQRHWSLFILSAITSLAGECEYLGDSLSAVRLYSATLQWSVISGVQNVPSSLPSNASENLKDFYSSLRSFLEKGENNKEEKQTRERSEDFESDESAEELIEGFIDRNLDQEEVKELLGHFSKECPLVARSFSAVVDILMHQSLVTGVFERETYHQDEGVNKLIRQSIGEKREKIFSETCVLMSAIMRESLARAACVKKDSLTTAKTRNALLMKSIRLFGVQLETKDDVEGRVRRKEVGEQLLLQENDFRLRLQGIAYSACCILILSIATLPPAHHAPVRRVQSAWMRESYREEKQENVLVRPQTCKDRDIGRGGRIFERTKSENFAITEKVRVQMEEEAGTWVPLQDRLESVRKLRQNVNAEISLISPCDLRELQKNFLAKKAVTPENDMVEVTDSTNKKRKKMVPRYLADLREQSAYLQRRIESMREGRLEDALALEYSPQEGDIEAGSSSVPFMRPVHPKIFITDANSEDEGLLRHSFNPYVTAEGGSTAPSARRQTGSVLGGSRNPSFYNNGTAEGSPMRVSTISQSMTIDLDSLPKSKDLETGKEAFRTSMVESSREGRLSLRESKRESQSMVNTEVSPREILASVSSVPDKNYRELAKESIDQFFETVNRDLSRLYSNSKKQERMRSASRLASYDTHRPVSRQRDRPPALLHRESLKSATHTSQDANKKNLTSQKLIMQHSLHTNNKKKGGKEQIEQGIGKEEHSLLQRFNNSTIPAYQTSRRSSRNTVIRRSALERYNTTDGKKNFLFDYKKANLLCQNVAEHFNNTYSLPPSTFHN